MELTQEQLAEIIAKVFQNLDERIKAEGGDLSNITTEEIMAEISAVIGEMDSAPAQDDKGDDNDGNAADALIAKIMSALENFKADPAAGGETPEENQENDPEPAPEATPAEQKQTATPDMQTKAAAAPVQRKYADIFLSGTRNRSIGAPNFKSRLEKMSTSERRKTTYGMFGRAVKCINASNGDVERAAYVAEHTFSDKEMAHEFKALSATSPADGGYLVPEVYANEIIELLYPSTVIYALGARRLGMSSGNMNIPKIKTGSRAMFNGEERKIPKTAPKFGNLKLSAKKLTALIPMSNDLLRSTNFDNDVIVGQDITQQMALGVDYGALLGTGGEFQPLGIIANKNVLNIDVTSIGNDYASNTGVLTAMFPNYMVAAVLKNNTYATGLGFAFNTSVEQFFKSLRDNSGGFIFADEMNANETLAGYPYKATNLFETVGGKTQIVFGNWNDLIIGEQGALEITTSREGSWTDDAGNMVSAFENDQTLIRAINNVDAGLRHEESFAVATKVAVPV